MHAIALRPGTTDVRLVERPEPDVNGPDEINVRILEVGICGTDRDEASGGRAEAPPGADDLIIGHEMLGQVTAVGPGVGSVKPGDYAVFTVRRGCGRCPACAMNRSDMCYTGGYVERGIKQRDGYQAEYVVDREQYIVKVPPPLRPIGVLAEPLSVVEKAIAEAVSIQVQRLPDVGKADDWLARQTVLVAGLGPIGLLAAMALRLRGAKVLGLDIVDEETERPQFLQQLGGAYVDGRQTSPTRLYEAHGDIHLILEATGVASLEFDLLSALANNGIYVLTGIPAGDRPLSVDGAAIMRQLVLRNQVIVGSVNASREHFQLAVDDLAQAQARWGSLIEKLISHRLPYTEYEQALTQHPADEIKTVLVWHA